MSIRLDDDREYAWLLVRSDALSRELVKVWEFVPIRTSSVLARLVGYPLRLVVFLVTMLVVVAWALLILVPLLQIPVAAYAYVHRFLPDWLWLTLLGAGLLAAVGTLATSIGVWIPSRIGGTAPASGASPSGVASHLTASPVTGEGGWDRWRSVHVSHDSSRGALFAGLAICIGILLQCLAVTLASSEFAGRIDTGWQWPLLFSERLLNTMLLGIPSGVVPTFADIRPVTAGGQLMLTGVDLCYASGAIAMFLRTMLPAFKHRDLFKGTTRDLADHLENYDLSRGTRLMIHRVGVVRPLDENEVVSVTKAEFFARVAPS